jgi:hypothetical protein
LKLKIHFGKDEKMKVTQKMALLPILILLLAAAFAYGEEANQAPQQPPPGEQQAVPPPPPESQDRPRFMLDENYIADLLEKIKQNDPNEAQRLESLREENPRLFQVEIRKLAWQYREPREGTGPDRTHRGTAAPGPEGEPEALRGRERSRERLLERETEFLSWLSKNEPNDANELTILKEKDPLAYVKRLSIEMKKYRQVVDAEQTNPALAELLKKDLGLKEKRNELLEKLKGTTDEKQKEELTAQLKEVIGERFDVIVQKQQLKYDELKKKLEELQKDVNKSQAELENYKNNKEELTKKHLDDLINKSGQFDWD